MRSRRERERESKVGSERQPYPFSGFGCIRFLFKETLNLKEWGFSLKGGMG